MADAEPQSPEFRGAELRIDVAEAVVSRGSAAELHPGFTRGQVELVVRDQDLGRRNRKISR